VNRRSIRHPPVRGFKIERELPLALVYEGHRLDKGFLADIVVERTVLLELKTVEHILPLHEARRHGRISV
jgi:GxxExxY protein